MCVHECILYLCTLFNHLSQLYITETATYISCFVGGLLGEMVKDTSWTTSGDLPRC